MTIEETEKNDLIEEEKLKKDDVREQELKILRAKILDAVRISKRYWMIYREGTFGISTILNLIYKKSYLEVLFFTNRDVLEKGVPLIKIHTPVETEIDFNEITTEPDFDEDGLISPLKIIKRLNRTINREYRYHLSVLEQELKLLDEHFESYSIENNPYNREIFIHFPDFFLNLFVNFEVYPLVPKISFSPKLSRIIKLKEFLEIPSIKEWDENEPLHIYELVEILIEKILNHFKMSSLLKDSQHLIFENVLLMSNVNKINIKLHKGQTLGIYIDPNHMTQEGMNLVLSKLHDFLIETKENFVGTIKIFGKHVQLLTTEEKNKIFIFSVEEEKDFKNLPLSKALKKGIRVKNPLKIQRKALEKILKKAGLFDLKDEIYEEIEKRARFFNVLRNWKLKKDFINELMEISGLIHKKDKKVDELNPLEFLIFSTCRILLQLPTIILIKIPPFYLNKLQYDKFNEFIKKIKAKYHVIFIFQAPEEIISQCNRILTISKFIVETGSLEDYRSKLPQAGEILLIELDNPKQEDIERMKNIESLLILEERKNEKYKIYTKRNPHEVFLLLIKIFGHHLYSFKKYQANLDDFIEYVQQINVNTNSSQEK
ncbi:MAG: hypothetical protein ACTSYC_08040 [Promethearchaeota archaeon]